MDCRWALVTLLIITLNLRPSLCDEDISSIDKNAKKVKKISPKKDPNKVAKIEKLSKININDDTAEAEVSTTVRSTITEAPQVLDPNLSNDEERLLHDLLFLKKRNRKARPVKDWNDPVTVNLGMALIHLDLDEHKSILEIDAWMRFNWTDEFLTWSPDNYSGISQLHLRTWDLWRPDIHLYNNADGVNMNHYGDVLHIVYNTGNVLWVPPAKLKAFCKVDLR